MADGSDGQMTECCAVEMSESVENYLKTLQAVASKGEPVTTSRVAVRLGVSPPSVSAMMGRLTSAGLVIRVGRRIELTEHGARHAQAIIRRHRLLETFLAQILGVPWDEVHAEAELLEHALSDRLADRIAAALGHPLHDPHGAPIPPKDGSYSEVWPDPLSAAPVGSQFRVQRVSGRHSEQLQYLGTLGIRPGATLLVEERTPFGGPLWVSLDGRRHGLGEPLTHHVHGVIDGSHGQQRDPIADGASHEANHDDPTVAPNPLMDLTAPRRHVRTRTTPRSTAPKETST